MSKAKKVAQEAVDTLAAAADKPYPNIIIDDGRSYPGWIEPVCPQCKDVVEVMTSQDAQFQCRRCQCWFPDPNDPKRRDSAEPPIVRVHPVPRSKSKRNGRR